MQLKDKKVLVVGLRRTGVAAARFLASNGARVTVTDKGEPGSFDNEKEILAQYHVRYVLGEHRVKDFTGTDLLVASPGVPLSIPEILKADKAGVEIISELELASRFISVPMVAVTGTNGKSTVTSMIGEMLNSAGKRSFVGGNIGNPLLNLILSGEQVAIAVVEVSSFQLEGIKFFKPDVAVLLNITPDHLDRYSDMESYASAKSRVFANQGPENWAIINTDDKLAVSLYEGAHSSLVGFSGNRKPMCSSKAWIDGNEMLLDIDGYGSGDFTDKRERISIARMKLAGKHNRENAIAAAVAVRLMGASIESIEGTLSKFTGLPHRMEYVLEVDNVRYFDDSKGTNVGAVEKSLGGFDAPVVLIAGGLDKGGDFAPLKPLLRERARALVLMGSASEKMSAQIGGIVPTEMAGDMKDAVRRAGKLARPGDVVLLSPACASFDMFRDYSHRGDVFKKAVRELIAD